MALPIRQFYILIPKYKHEIVQQAFKYARAAKRIRYLPPELAPIATALTEELSGTVSQSFSMKEEDKRSTDCRRRKATPSPSFSNERFEQELLAGGESASERRATLVAVLRASEAPLHKISTGQMRPTDEDGSTDCLSAKPVAKLRRVSSAHVKKLAKAGGLDELDTDTQWCDEGRTGGRTGTL